jgi:DNA invertase Pin-like site-specific DNA recombinase
MVENRQIRHGSPGEEVWLGSLSESAGPIARGQERKRPPRGDVVPTPPSNGASAPNTPVIGYASCMHAGEAGTRELKQQASVVSRECKRRGLHLIELVGEREPTTGKGLARPGLSYALDRIRSSDAEGLVVAELSRITYSAAELGTVMEWLVGSGVRLIAAAQGLDTDSEDGRLAASMLIEVSRWERVRLSERTRNGLQAARKRGKASGRGAVTDDPDLSERITEMRARGMTLQAIADRLNEEGVPTVRGGAKWRHSSVQAAAGYRRSSSPQLRGTRA